VVKFDKTRQAKLCTFAMACLVLSNFTTAMN